MEEKSGREDENENWENHGKTKCGEGDQEETKGEKQKEEKKEINKEGA